METLKINGTLLDKGDTLTKTSVLLIDDNQETMMVQKLLLGFEGFEVFTAQSGGEALEVLATIPKPNLILLDMQMDDMTGLDFLKRLETQRPEIIDSVPVVFLTGMEDVPPSRAVGYIRKASSVDVFLTEVHRYLKAGAATQ